MDTYAAKRLAMRKFIEHKGQDFLRQNTQRLVSDTRTDGDVFKMIWRLEDVRPEDRLVTGEMPEQGKIVIAVNLETGAMTVEEDTISAREEDLYHDIVDKSWIADSEEDNSEA